MGQSCFLEKGFTLLELVIVIAILGLISVAVVAKYRDLRHEAATAHADSVFETAETAVARHFAKKLMGTVSDNITTCSELTSYMTEDPTKAGWTCSGVSLKANIGGSAFEIRIKNKETSTSRAELCCTWQSSNCPICS